MIIKELVEILDNFSPFCYAEDYDNVGLIIGEYETKVSGVLVCHDALESVIEEAIKKKCNVVISFHPIIFKEIKKLNNTNYVQKVITKSIKNDISIISIHTALDNSIKGVNHTICEKLELKNTSILIPKKHTKENENIGLGMLGELKESMKEKDFIKYLKRKMNTELVRHSNFINKKIKKIAVLGGSGSFAISNALLKKADAFVTSDLKYHDFFQSDNKILLCDIGHYESEQFTKNLIHSYLTKKIANFAIILSETKTNPVNYS